MRGKLLVTAGVGAAVLGLAGPAGAAQVDSSANAAPRLAAAASDTLSGKAQATTKSPSGTARSSTATGTVDFSAGLARCDGDYVGSRSYQIEYGRSGVIRMGTVHQLQKKVGARWVNVRGGKATAWTAFFPNNAASFEASWRSPDWFPTYTGVYRVAVQHKFRTATTITTFKQVTPGCRVT